MIVLCGRAFPVIDSITVTTLPIAVCAYMKLEKISLGQLHGIGYGQLPVSCDEEISTTVVSAWWNH